MATIVSGETELSGLRNTLSFGPYKFQLSEIYAQFLATEIQISAVSTAQLIGGVSPTIAAISAINFLLLYPDQQMKVGLHGVAAQASGFTLNAYGLHIDSKCSIDSLAIYNTSTTTMNVFVILGQT